jgi:signal peptidase I
LSEKVQSGASQKRTFWAAVLLAVLTPGLGLIYCGKLRQGLYVLGGSILLWLINAFIGNPAIKILLVLTYFALYAVQVIWSLVAALRSDENYTLRRYNRLIVYALIFMLFAAYMEFDNTYFTEISAIPSDDMAPSLIKNDMVIVNKLASRLSKPRRGDVVVYFSDSTSRLPFVARVLGEPGDEVRLQQGRYVVNGQGMEHAPILQLAGRKSTVPAMVNGPVVKLSNMNYYLAGDNPKAAYDSRFTGPVPVDRIVGRIDAVLYSVRLKRPEFSESP